MNAYVECWLKTLWPAAATREKGNYNNLNFSRHLMQFLLTMGFFLSNQSWKKGAVSLRLKDPLTSKCVSSAMDELQHSDSWWTIGFTCVEKKNPLNQNHLLKPNLRYMQRKVAERQQWMENQNYHRQRNLGSKLFSISKFVWWENDSRIMFSWKWVHKVMLN